jgi:hypothetical protein
MNLLRYEFHLEAAKPNAQKKNAIHATLALIGRSEQRPVGAARATK